MTSYVNLLQQDNFKDIYHQHGINYLGIFGSVARGENTPQSDIDLLIDFDETQSLFDLAKIKIYFQDVLGREVDLTLRGNEKEILKPYINQDLITIYEKN